MPEISEPEKAARKKRVLCLKKLILLLVSTAILIPTVLCIVLFFQLGTLEKEVRYLAGQLAETKELVEALNSMEARNSIGNVYKNWQDTWKAPEAVKADSRAVQNTQDGVAEAAASQQAAPEDRKKERKVYLTFDDGPSTHTNEILDILAAYDVKATFFVVGKEDTASQEAMRRIVEEGHTLGMHSYSHKYSQLYESVDTFARDLTRLQEYLYEVTGVTSQYYRFPGGSSNTVSSVDMQEFIRYLRDKEVEYFDWNISSGDASSTALSADTVVANCTANLSKHENAMILMHDAAGKQTTIKALPGIIEAILAMENTVIVPIAGDTEPIQHITINYEGTEE